MSSRINSREQLKEYCLRSLGSPVILINVSDDQVEDRIDDALDLFWEYHADGSERTFISYQLTEIDVANKYVTLPEGVLSVISVLTPNANGGFGGGLGLAGVNLQLQMYTTDMMNPRRLLSGGLSNWYVTSSYMELMADTFSTPPRFEFNKHSNRLSIHDGWEGSTAGAWIMVEVDIVNDPAKYGEVFNNRWLKRYATALIKRQWGQNLIKFAGAQLPGGMTVNAEQIHQDAQAEVQALEEQLYNNEQAPVDFFMG